MVDLIERPEYLIGATVKVDEAVGKNPTPQELATVKATISLIAAEATDRLRRNTFSGVPTIRRSTLGQTLMADVQNLERELPDGLAVWATCVNRLDTVSSSVCVAIRAK